MAKKQYMNLFFGDTYKQTEEMAWQERGTSQTSKPVMKNGNFEPTDDIYLKKGQSYNLALFLNMSEKKVKYISSKIEESNFDSNENKLSKKDIEDVFNQDSSEDTPF